MAQLSLCIGSRAAAGSELRLSQSNKYNRSCCPGLHRLNSCPSSQQQREPCCKKRLLLQVLPCHPALWLLEVQSEGAASGCGPKPPTLNPAPVASGPTLRAGPHQQPLTQQSLPAGHQLQAVGRPLWLTHLLTEQKRRHIRSAGSSLQEKDQLTRQVLCLLALHPSNERLAYDRCACWLQPVTAAGMSRPFPCKSSSRPEGPGIADWAPSVALDGGRPAHSSSASRSAASSGPPRPRC